jgi:hypothetical protein
MNGLNDILPVARVTRILKHLDNHAIIDGNKADENTIEVNIPLNHINN